MHSYDLKICISITEKKNHQKLFTLNMIARGIKILISLNIEVSFKILETII